MKSDMKIRHYIAASLLPAILPVALHAQTAAKDTTLNRTVVVEQEYTPEIMDARKVNVMPEVEPLNVEKRRVEYDGALMPARTLPAGVMQPSSVRRSRPPVPPAAMPVWAMATETTLMWLPPTALTRRNAMH